MTETPDATQAAPKRAGGLNTMLVADLKGMAQGLGIAGAGSMKKPDLIAAIRSAQGTRKQGGDKPAEHRRSDNDGGVQTTDRAADQGGSQHGEDQHARRPKQDQPQGQGGQQAQDQSRGQQDQPRDQRKGQPGNQQKGQSQVKKQDQQAGKNADQPKRDRQPNSGPPEKQEPKEPRQQPEAHDGHDDGDGEDDGQPRSRSRRRRGRERQNRPVAQPGTATAARGEPDPTILDDDVLVPAAGILDVLDSYAFVRTVGYLPSPDDVYLSLSMVRKFGLRRGDQLVGQVRQPREGERKEKFNPMVRIDSVNGHAPDLAVERPEFDRLVPLHPADRLRMETTPDNLTGRVIDLAAPIGKGQRGLIISPARAGKTTLIQGIAASVTANAPDAHLMVILVDERPEEVTDFKREIKGEVAACTFDHQPADHVAVAELAIERAKRLVEQGMDVVVLLDGITRLTRAYNLATPASGRVLSGGLDPAAVHPSKRFFGAARNIQNGGSLTIIATASADSGSAVDETILEEFQGTGNWELHLSRDLADRRIFPAVDVNASATAHEELLMGEQEVEIVRKLRTALAGRAPHEALEALLRRLTATRTNIETLTGIQRATPAELGR